LIQDKTASGDVLLDSSDIDEKKISLFHRNFLIDETQAKGIS